MLHSISVLLHNHKIITLKNAYHLSMSDTESEAPFSERCAICQHDVGSNGDPVTMPCNHMFCDCCLDGVIESALQKIQTHVTIDCPLCKADILPTLKQTHAGAFPNQSKTYHFLFGNDFWHSPVEVNVRFRDKYCYVRLTSYCKSVQFHSADPGEREPFYTDELRLPGNIHECDGNAPKHFSFRLITPDDDDEVIATDVFMSLSVDGNWREHTLNFAQHYQTNSNAEPVDIHEVPESHMHHMVHDVRLRVTKRSRRAL